MKRTLRSRRRTAAGFAAILSGILLSLVGVIAAPASAADVNPTSVFDVNDGPGGNATCAAALAGLGAPATTQLGGQGGFTSNGAHSDGTLSVSTSGFPGPLTFQVTGVDPNVRVYAVLIKQASATRVYYYANGVPIGDGDSGLAGVNGGISNFKFCYAVPAPTFGSLSVDKVVDGNDPQDPALVFTLTVDCDVNGTPVDLNGGAAGNTATVTLTAGQAPTVLSNIPTGATCDVVETIAQGADATAMTVGGGAPIPGNTASNVPIGNGTTVAVVATNTFNTGPQVPTFGSLSVDKAVDGNDPQDPALVFTLTVDCDVNGTPVDLNGKAAGNTATVTLTAGQAPTVLSNIPTGATCTVAETNSQGADATSITVDGGAPTPGTTVSGIVIGNATTVAVVATNTFNAAQPNPTFGSLSLDKVVNGNDPQDPALLFTFTVDCTSNGQPVDLNGGAAGNTATVTITAGAAPSVLANIPSGAICTITETNAQGADATSITVDGGAPTAGNTVSNVAIGNGTTVAVVATNTFNTAGGGQGPGGGGGGGTPPPPIVQPTPPVTPPVTPPAQVDECPTLPGVQLNPDDCLVEVLPTPPIERPVVPEVPETPVAPETPAPQPPTNVGGVVVPRSLPQTGTDALPLVQMGLGMILLGAGAVLFGRERTAPI